MDAGSYDRLTALDASFLEIEDENCHMHVAATLLFDPGTLVNRSGGIDAERIRQYIASRLHLIPRYRQKLAYIPLEQHPVWIDDERFNLFYHVRHASLPRPGDDRQLKRMCGRLMSQKLDHTKPLWEIWIVEGLANGRFALVAKAHHCMVDGVSGVDLLNVLLQPSPEEAFEPALPWCPRPAPSGVELVAGEVCRRAKLSLQLVRSAAATLIDPVGTAAAAFDVAAGFAEVLGDALSSAPQTPFNPAAIGPHRRFDWMRVPLADIKHIRQNLGGTLNDVVLATVVGAARSYLQRHRFPIARTDFRALIPVSVRSAAEHGALGNRVAQLLAHLPLGEPDPRRRLARVSEVTTKLKHSQQVHTTELVEELSDWTATSVLSQTMRFAAERRAYNLIVTNVPGPGIPLFLLGAPLRATYPMVPLFTTQALGIALFSYCGNLYWGLNADWDTLPDLHDFATDLECSFAELLAAGGVQGATAHHACHEVA